ncbi:MAG: tetratricopeptide repeat protein [Proteobacteria bacterium]|nr:tetratricopeptide repeat protein [Pseudomonadota bacterium]
MRRLASHLGRLGACLLLIAACHGTPPAKPSAAKPLARAAYAHYLAGKMAIYQRDWGAATVALEAACRAAPDEPMIVVELARAQAKASDPRARATLAEARQAWPTHAEIWIVSGDLADPATAEAAAMYHRAIALAPDDERGYLGLARVEPAQAEATLRTLVARVPTSVDGHYQLAVKLIRRDALAAAIPELRAVLERDPDHIDARLDLARALRQRGLLDEAVMQTRSAFDRAAQPLDVAEELFWVLVEADDRTGAIDLLTLLDDDRSDVEALATIARLDRGLGRLDEARAIAEKIGHQDADAGEIALAEIEHAAGDPAAALARLAPIPETSEHVVLARRAAAEILLATGEHARVGPLLATVRAAHPKNVELALLAAYARADDHALADAKAILAPLGDAPEVRFARARLADRVGDPSPRPACTCYAPVRWPLATRRSSIAGACSSSTKAPSPRRSARSPGRTATRRATPRSSRTSPRAGSPTTRRGPPPSSSSWRPRCTRLPPCVARSTASNKRSRRPGDKIAG